MPRCELSRTTTDFHRIVYDDGQGVVAKLVFSEPRFLLQEVATLSVRLATLDLATQDRWRPPTSFPPAPLRSKRSPLV